MRIGLIVRGVVDKQKKLLAADSGHFSMIKMLHLADLITELNGNFSLPFYPRQSCRS